MLAPVEIAAASAGEPIRAARQRPEKLPPLITVMELEAHTAFVAKELGEKSTWGA
jgi:DNA polymerase-3 subunit epsilon